MKSLMMSDDKIFNLDEANGGGVWLEEWEDDPEQKLWQGKVKEHVWGGVTHAGPLPLIFLEGGTFKGQKSYDKALADLQEKKAGQRVSVRHRHTVCIKKIHWISKFLVRLSCHAHTFYPLG